MLSDCWYQKTWFQRCRRQKRSRLVDGDLRKVFRTIYIFTCLFKIRPQISLITFVDLVITCQNCSSNEGGTNLIQKRCSTSMPKWLRCEASLATFMWEFYRYLGWFHVFLQTCEKDLKQFLETRLDHPVATYIDELKGTIKVRGADRSLIELFVYEQGFWWVRNVVISVV